jgi:magnesium-transporting ATPase (P-type)
MVNHHKVKTNGKGIKKPQSWDFDYVGCSKETILERLATSEQGLSEHEARKRLEEYGTNEPGKKVKKHSLLQIALKFLRTSSL